MDQTLTLPKLKLNKKVISRLQHYRPAGKIVDLKTLADCFTVFCTIPECASVAMNCRTDSLQSCAPCVPPPKDPAGRP